MRESEFFAARAAAAQAEADAAVLDNVRERSLRAFHAWDTMAQRSLRSEGARDAREAAAASAQAAAADSARPDFMLTTGETTA